MGLPGEAADVVLAHAVHAADVAAVADGNRIGYYDATMERAHRERQELTEDLRVAVERGEFLLAFQPIVTAKEGTVVAAEALLRWVDKKRGPVSPMDFIPVAEETGLILPIGRWVLNEACRRATTWPHVAGRPIDVSVNVSPIQLMDEGFVDDVAEALERSGLPASRLRVEITEGIVLEDIERTILRIHQLREMGVETMLDDFGTGHSSLAWVQRLPVSCIKIDRAFVNDVAVDGIDRAIVHASLYLSRALGTETVAEGVETEAQREQLIRMGCQKLQGYLFARPQPATVFPDWLAKQRARAQAGAPDAAGRRPASGNAGRRPAPAYAQQPAAAPAYAPSPPRRSTPSSRRSSGVPAQPTAPRRTLRSRAAPRSRRSAQHRARGDRLAQRCPARSWHLGSALRRLRPANGPWSVCGACPLSSAPARDTLQGVTSPATPEPPVLPAFAALPLADGPPPPLRADAQRNRERVLSAAARVIERVRRRLPHDGGRGRGGRRRQGHRVPPVRRSQLAAPRPARRAGAPPARCRHRGPAAARPGRPAARAPDRLRRRPPGPPRPPRRAARCRRVQARRRPTTSTPSPSPCASTSRICCASRATRRSAPR